MIPKAAIGHLSAYDSFRAITLLEKGNSQREIARRLQGTSIQEGFLGALEKQEGFRGIQSQG